MPHNFVIEELNLKTKTIKPGASDILEFTVPDDMETLTYFCSISNHRAMGMEGKFEIK